MNASAITRCTGTWVTRRARLLAGASCAALAIACSLPPPASAAEYFAGSASEFQIAITAINTATDSNATITLTGSFALPMVAPTATQPITIDTRGFTLAATVFVGPAITLGGNVVAGGTSGVQFTGAGRVLTNNGLLTGAGGHAATLGGGASLINNGTITGQSNATGGGAGARTLTTGGTIINNSTGTIQGGDSLGAGGPGTSGVGAGIWLVAATGSAAVINFGTIRGGGTDGPGGAGNAGIFAQSGAGQTITNAGTIEGGIGAAGIGTSGSARNVTIVNSGIIRPGSGQADAIQLTTDTTGTSLWSCTPDR